MITLYKSIVYFIFEEEIINKHYLGAIIIYNNDKKTNESKNL